MNVNICKSSWITSECHAWRSGFILNRILLFKLSSLKVYDMGCIVGDVQKWAL